LDVNVISLFSVCREFARNNKKGTIVNFSSIYGVNSPRPDLYDGSHKEVGYCVSKSAVLNLTKYLAVHLAPNIKVNCVVPGGVLQSQSIKFVRKYSKLTPTGRMMRKDELNGLLDYLCSKKSSYVTGSAIMVDGGYTVY
jgi:NAD(P)-dependent dehydrogenase (short-subunit alcohol dehydrogenase family)